MAEPILELRNIHKSFDGQEVLRGISLDVRAGEFITLLGASGCGKTTTLRIIAGLEKPDAGSVILRGQDVTALAPNRRDVNTIFQNYALFPHMNVAENIGYGLKIEKRSRQEIQSAVREALAQVQLSGYEKRRVTELSGGQKQRVAIARAIVKKPHVLLLDEPLGALDLQLRRQMQLELKRMQKQLGVTFIYITHDQEEAINMSDRIAVMRGGSFAQIGTPEEVYDRPQTAYVARFVGNANILRGTFRGMEGQNAVMETGGALVRVLAGGRVPDDLREGAPVCAAVRSENILLEEGGENTLEAVVAEKSFVAGQLRMELRRADGSRVVASRHGINSRFREGETIRFGFLPENAVLVDGEEGMWEEQP